MAREALPLVQERIREELVAFRRQERDQAFELTPIHWKRCLTELVEIGLTSAIQALRSDNQVGPRWRALRSQFAAHLTPMRGNQHCSGLLLWCDACVAILSNLEEAGVLPKTPLRVSSQYVRIRLIKMDSLRANLSAC
ncbi:MAG: hypothetical protein DCC75_08855 [Proteobacteria bacterium]|nr:MAG: hypothetical protein DCC75_08855 [Pseudomonadota bacterium]